MLRPDQLDVERAMVLVIDVQEKLLPSIVGGERVIAAGRKLLDGAGVFELPVLVTEQYPKGLGPTHATIRAALPRSRTNVLEKPTFSAWADAKVREALLAIDRPQIIVTGIETHVCVQQTALDLRSRDYDVFVCADAAGSRGRVDHEVALDRMRQAGVLVTTVESVLFELCQRCDTARFKAMLAIIKANPPSGH
ncbi:MAG: hydrolase [Planctomycetota bacterium]